MAHIIHGFDDDTHPSSFIPAINYLMQEARREGFDEAARLLGAVLESLKDELDKVARAAH